MFFCNPFCSKSSIGRDKEDGTMTCGNHNFKNALYVPAVTLPSPGCPNSTNTKTIQTGGLERIGSYDSSEGSDTFEDTNVENTFSIVEKSQFNESIRTSSTSELSTDRSASLSSIGSETLEEEDVEVSFTSSSSSFTSSSRRSMKFENKKSRQVSFLEGSEKYKANNNEQLSFVMGMDDDSNNADGDFQNKMDKGERSSSLPAMKGDDKTTYTKEDAVTPLPKITPTKTKKRRNSKKKVLVDTPDKKLIVTDDNIIVITPNKVVVAKKPVGGEKPKFVEMDRTLFQEDNSGQRRSSSSSSQSRRSSSNSSKSSISKKLFALDTSSSSNSATSVSSCIAEMGLMKRLSSTSSPTAILHHIATSPRAA